MDPRMLSRRLRWHTLALFCAFLVTITGCGASSRGNGRAGENSGDDSLSAGNSSVPPGAGSGGGDNGAGGNAGSGNAKSNGGESSEAAGMSGYAGKTGGSGSAGTSGSAGNTGSGDTAGMSGNGGQAGSGNAGNDGGMAQATPIVCPEGTLAGGSTQSLAPDVRQTFSGTNGTFIDACDENGDLTAYECEVEYESVGGDQDLGTILTGTGAVTQTTIACAGTCVDGTCVGVCEQQGDEMQIVSADDSGNATLEDERTHWTYDCEVYANSCGPFPPGTEFQLVGTDGCWQANNNLIAVGNGPMGASCSYKNCVPVNHP